MLFPFPQIASAFFSGFGNLLFLQFIKRLQSFSVEKLLILVHLLPLAILCMNILSTGFVF